MSDYLETVQPTDKGEHTGRLVLNTNYEDSSLYDLGTWRNRTEPSTSQYITVDAKFLHELADYILTYVPEPDPLTDAHMVHAEHKKSLYITTFALIEGMWYDTDGGEYSEEHLLEDYNITEVLR